MVRIGGEGPNIAIGDEKLGCELMWLAIIFFLLIPLVSFGISALAEVVGITLPLEVIFSILFFVFFILPIIVMIIRGAVKGLRIVCKEVNDRYEYHKRSCKRIDRSMEGDIKR